MTAGRLVGVGSGFLVVAMAFHIARNPLETTGDKLLAAGAILVVVMTPIVFGIVVALRENKRK